MNATNSGLNAVKLIIRLVLLVLVFLAIYYLYKYLFTSSNLDIKVINDGFISAKTNQQSFALSSTYPNVPVVYTGGEMTISSWIYVSDWQNVNSGKPKHILTVGKDVKEGFMDFPMSDASMMSEGFADSCNSGNGSGNGSGSGSGSGTPSINELSNEQTLVVFLDSYNNELHTAVSLTPLDANDMNSTILKRDLVTTVGSGSNVTTTFNGEALKGKAGAKCSVKDVELQKWILFTFCLNNKVMDIYMDGKLARSCVLPSMFSVGGDVTKPLSVKMAGYGGFGGFIGRTVMTNYAMNPEEVWKLYMGGPGPEMTLWKSITGLFDPNVYKDVKFPELKWD